MHKQNFKWMRITGYSPDLKGVRNAGTSTSPLNISLSKLSSVMAVETGMVAQWG